MNYGPTTAIARRPIATAVMHDKAATDIRKLASSVKDDLPGMHVHRHLADAAEQLGHRNKEGALRHLHAGMHALAPQSLMRHGIVTDDEAAKAKAHMDAINRHALRLRDIQDLEGRNQNLRSAATAMNAPAHIGSGGTGGSTNPGVPYSGSMKHLDAKPWAKAVGQSAGGSLVGMANGPAPYHRDPDENLWCPNCGKYDDTDARYCDQCGYEFQPADYKDIRLSAETARLAVTPAPRGKPGGPGLYDVKGMQHTPYFQNIVKALIRDGHTPDEAYRLAWGAIRRWSRGGGHVHPEVRAAAAASVAGERAAGAAARAAHGHSNWDDVCQAIELAGTAWQQQQRVPKGQPGGGQFGSKGKPGGQQGKPGAKHHVNAAVRKMSPQQKQHLKDQLLLTARTDRARAHQLGLQLRALLQSLNVSHTKTTNPAKAAARAKAAASTKAKASATAKSGSKAASSASTRAQNLARVGQLRQQIHQLLQAASAAQKRASTL